MLPGGSETPRPGTSPQETLARALQDSLVAHLEELGIAPDDKRIDWAKDSSDYVQGRRRFDASLAKIQ